MSSQLNFFSVPEDGERFADFFARKGGQFLAFKQEDKVVRPMEKIWFEDGRWPHQVGLVPIDFIGDVAYREHGIAGKYGLDVTKSWVIEYDTGGAYPSTPNVLHRSRFYAVNDYFASNDMLVTKSDTFKKWVRNFYRAFKKEFLRKAGNASFITYTNACLDWMKETNAVVDRPALTIIKP